MAIAHCKRCGRIFNRVRRDICPTCVVEEDRAFATVRTYLHDHRDTTMEELVEGTGTDESLVVSLIRNGRLILRDNPNLTYACERCGQPTQVGRFCARCTQKLADEGRGKHSSKNRVSE